MYTRIHYNQLWVSIKKIKLTRLNFHPKENSLYLPQNHDDNKVLVSLRSPHLATL